MPCLLQARQSMTARGHRLNVQFNARSIDAAGLSCSPGWYSFCMAQNKALDYLEVKVAGAAVPAAELAIAQPG